MRLYYYLLFRIYQYYIKNPKEKSIILFNVTAASTVIIFVNIFTLYSLLDYTDIIPMFPSKYYVILIMFLLGIINYRYFVKPKKFLDYNFKKEVKGLVFIIVYLIISIIFYIIVANLNRAKIFKEQSMKPSTEKVEQKPSLEGRIRKWFK